MAVIIPFFFYKVFFLIFFKFFILFIIYLSVHGCVGSSFLCEGFL